MRNILVYEGVATVRPGTVVNKGDVLITGLISGSGSQITDTPPLRLTDARGSVRAEVVRVSEVYVPTVEEYTHSESGEKKGYVISLFGHEIAFGSTEDATLESEKNITIFGVVELPITVKTYTEQITVSTTVSRDSNTARLEAERQLYQKITETLGDGELTFLETEYTENENGWHARAELLCVVEIAVPYKSGTKGE